MVLAAGFFEGILGSLGSFSNSALAFLFVLIIVIFVHEFGHFWVARRCGVHVETFALGFGPSLWSRTDKLGTVWAVKAIPLGGYVKFRGDMNAASVTDFEAAATMSEQEKQSAFPFKPLWQRAAIVAAGPIANFIFALLVLALSFMLVGRSVVEPVIMDVVAGTPAAKAGMMAQDRVTSIDEQAITSFDQIQRAVASSNGNVLTFGIDRAGREIKLNITPEIVERKTGLGVQRLPVLGVRVSNLPQHIRHERYGPLDSIGKGAAEIGFVIARTTDYIGGIISGREKADQLSGPIGIARVSGKMAEAGFVPLITLAAILSISIGFLNLMPIPLLDGGHLAFYLYEAVFRRAPSEKVQNVGFRVGFALLILMMLFATKNDILQLVS